MTDKDIEVTTVNNEAEDEETKPVEVYSEKADAEAPVLDSEQIKAAALAYAKYLREQGLIPGDATFVEPEEIGVDLEEKTAEAEDSPEEENAEAEETAEAEPEEKAPEQKKRRGSEKESRQRTQKEAES